MEYMVYGCLAILFGFFQKLADGHNEHGLHFFPGAGILFGIFWGLIGFIIMSHSVFLFIQYYALVMYWGVKGKIDAPNHLISVVIMLMSVLYMRISLNHTLLVLGIFLLYYFLDYLKRHGNYQNHFFYKYWGHFFLIPIVSSLFQYEFLGVLIIFNLFGVKIAKIIFLNPSTQGLKSSNR